MNQSDKFRKIAYKLAKSIGAVSRMNSTELEIQWDPKMHKLKRSQKT